MNYTRREREEMAGVPVSVYEEAAQLRERAEAAEADLAEATTLLREALGAQRSALRCREIGAFSFDFTARIDRFLQAANAPDPAPQGVSGDGEEAPTVLVTLTADEAQAILDPKRYMDTVRGGRQQELADAAKARIKAALEVAPPFDPAEFEREKSAILRWLEQFDPAATQNQSTDTAHLEQSHPIKGNDATKGGPQYPVPDYRPSDDTVPSGGVQDEFEILAEAAYEAYISGGHPSFDGLPDWAGQSESVRNHWRERAHDDFGTAVERIRDSRLTKGEIAAWIRDLADNADATSATYYRFVAGQFEADQPSKGDANS